MKNIQTILIIAGVITIATIVIILVMRNASKNQLKKGTNDPLPLFDMPTSANPQPSSAGPIPITEDQRRQLETACGIPSSKAAVERIYGIKCSWYGF